MSELILFLSYIILWLASQIRRTFLHLSIFQLKEFRFDRYFSFLKTDEGKILFLKTLPLLKFVLLFLYFLGFYKILCAVGIFIIITFEGIYSLYKLIFFKFNRPRFTFKITVLTLLYFFIFFFTSFYLIYILTSQFKNLYIFNQSLSINLILLDRLQYPILFIVVSFLIPLNNILRKKSFKKLKELLKKRKDLKIITITGSYGKTSTKIFLYKILKSKFKVLLIPKNINTDIGISNFIIKNLKPFHQILITEIGAYKIGEIERIGKILNPDISILTAISNQHLELFGSQKNIIKAKFEIAKILKENGIFIVNIDSPFIEKNLNFTKNLKLKIKKVSIYKKACYYAKNIKEIYKNSQPNGLEFDLIFNSKKEKFKTKLISKNFLINLLLALVSSDILGIKIKDSKNIIENISQPQHSLKIYKTKNKNLIIDDSYSSNLEGFLEAIRISKKIKKENKILIFRSLIELGKEGIPSHIKLSKEIAKTFNFVILTSYDYKEIIINALKQEKFNLKNFFFEKNPKKIKKILKNIIKNKKTLILTENRIPYEIINFLKSQ